MMLIMLLFFNYIILRKENEYVENTLYDAGIERKAGDWSCGSHPDTGGTDRTGHYI